MWLKFNLNFMLLKIIHGACRVLHKIHTLLGKIYLFRTSHCVYLIFEKLSRCFDRQAIKCQLILASIKTKK